MPRELIHTASNAMSEPASTGLAGALGWKALGLGALIGAGVLGAVVAAVFDPPKDRKTMFKQFAVAGISSLFFGPLALRFIDQWIEWVDFKTMSPVDLLEWSAPVYLLIGALSWGLFGAVVRMRQIIRERGADEVWRRGGGAAGPAQGGDQPPVA